MTADVAKATITLNGPAPRIRSKNHRMWSSRLPARETTKCYVRIFRLGLILLLVMYVLIAITYLATPGPPFQHQNENVRPLSMRKVTGSKQITKFDPSTKTTLSVTEDYENHDMIIASKSVYQQLRNAGASEQQLQQMHSHLPNWNDIVQQYGATPIIYNLDSCATYQALVPSQSRVLGAAGMFNTGTNLVTQLLKQNCYIPQRAILYGATATKEQLGIRWQVPWGKHTPAHYKNLHAASDKAAEIHAQDVLPIITIRHPYRWIQSMCHHPYTAKWDHYSQCPNVLAKQMKRININMDTKSINVSLYNPVTVQYGAGAETYASVPHLWNDWYNEYYQRSVPLEPNVDTPVGNNGSGTINNNSDIGESSYPLLIVRMEDLIFHTKDTITSICHCAGGQLYDHNFTYIVSSAKGDSPGHDTTTDIVNAYIKYGTPLTEGAGFEATDFRLTQQLLDQNLMSIFHYHTPASPK